MNFVSDNVMGASERVLQAIVRANDGAQAAYGTDEITRRVERRFNDVFERQVAVFPVLTGTAANALALAASVPPYGLCVCHREAHVIDDECGAPEFYTHGAKLAGLAGVGAKLGPADLEAFLASLSSSVKQMPAKALSISQTTECGLAWNVDEIAALSAICSGRGLALHMDGARFANALVALGCTPAEMTWKQGVDILSFGATKNGCLAAEAVIVFDPVLAETISYRRKRAGHTLSKGRLVAAQLDAYLAEDHWLDNARHANSMAARLADGLAAVREIRLAWPVEANEVFPIMPRRAEQALRRAGADFREWSDLSLPEGEAVGSNETLVRFVTSFGTEASAVDQVLAAARLA
jgi:threonine aldolase